MSVCGQNGQAEDDSASEDAVAPTSPSVVRDLYKTKPVSKVVRVLTVLAYLLSVSLAAILLSVYYVCVWKSPELPPEPAAPALSQHGARHGSPNVYGYARDDHNSTGGGDSTVNALVDPTPVNIETSLETETTRTDASTDFSSNSSAPLNTTPAFSSTNIEDFYGNNDTSVT